MALHAPSHHVPAPHISEHGRQLLRDLAIALVLAVAVLLVFGAAFMLRPGLPQLFVTQPESQPLVEFRAGERASWVAGQGQPLVEFRAGERAAWDAGQTSEGQSILLFRASERAER